MMWPNYYWCREIEQLVRHRHDQCKMIEKAQAESSSYFQKFTYFASERCLHFGSQINIHFLTCQHNWQHVNFQSFGRCRAALQVQSCCPYWSRHSIQPLSHDSISDLLWVMLDTLMSWFGANKQRYSWKALHSYSLYCLLHTSSKSKNGCVQTMSLSHAWKNIILKEHTMVWWWLKPQ